PDRRARYAGGHGTCSADYRAPSRRDLGRGNAERDPAEPQGARGLSEDMSPDVTEPLLEVEEVHTYYGKSHILDGVSLEVRTGEVVGLLGRNGVGKSTTLKAVAGLVHPSRGEVRFEGRPITRLPSHRVARLGIGYVPEDRRVFPLLTVTENPLSRRVPPGVARGGGKEGLLTQL